MKILISSDWYYPVVNGVVRSVLNLKEYLENQGHEVRVLTLSNTISSYKSEDVYYVGSLSARKIYPEARVTNILAKTHLRSIKKWEPDIIHSQCEFSTFVMAKSLSKMLNVPLVHTYHTVYEDYTHYFIKNKAAGVKIVAKASKTFADMCQYIIAPTKKTAKILESYNIDANKIAVIPTGIRIPDIYKEDLKDELDLDKDKKILLYLGRLAEEKNIEELIRFYEKLKDSSIAFYIVGGGPYLNKLKAYSKSFSKEINFVGMVEPSEVNKYYQAADIFTTASTSETQGLTYYEALSNGTVAICRDDNSLEGVIKDGFNGYRYHNFEEFNSYMNLVLDDEDFHKQLIDNARSYALENFSVESFGSKCEDLYKKAVNEYGYESSFIHKRL
ncbi:MAG: glycosyltransferase [Anaerococcus sp.]|uniref:Glycosyltransferase family 4 protein n=1 Tax=Anaerococcus nagyae TaxID=1755241 RepID=A0A3E2TFV5_9FIRM|nr:MULTISPECIES: glycosyltransferase [Anaerococcus]MBP2070088.1 1,2-diacylglycerol 3-alpha-glucosyltransferase [Anaerococcus nagyae]MDU1829153.1 glycosyltransferase [Anaerococcus sp.]MDU1865018.1 glycosyltransferase [Anaerococcus sp.]MDU2353714.1 glycosyltransferase [Anaerococcus sp.]MDU2566369.1 glycosyltransferase [Anaerococcus sp.]